MSQPYRDTSPAGGGHAVDYELQDYYDDTAIPVSIDFLRAKACHTQQALAMRHGKCQRSRAESRWTRRFQSPVDRVPGLYLFKYIC